MGYDQMDAVAAELAELAPHGQAVQRLVDAGAAVGVAAPEPLICDETAEAIADVALHVAAGVLGAVVEAAIESVFDAC